MRRTLKGVILKIAALLFLSVLTVTHVKADNADKLFDEANDFFLLKQYEEARASYELLINSGFKDPTLYFNLANTYMFLDMPGKAALYYHKAKKLEPRRDDIQKNLSVIDELNSDEIEEAGQSLSVKRFVRSFDFISKSEVAAAIVILYAFFFLWSLFKKFLRPGRLRITVNVLAIVSYIWTLLFIFIFVSTFYYDAVSPETIVIERAELYTAPADDDSNLSGIEVNAGTLVELKRTYNDWGEVTLSDDETGGWLMLDNIEKI